MTRYLAAVVASGVLPQLYSDRYSLVETPRIDAPAGIYTLAATWPTHELRGIQGVTYFEATFDTAAPPSGTYDPDPPWMATLDILVGATPSDHAYSNADYVVDTVIRDDNDVSAGSGACLPWTSACFSAAAVLPTAPSAVRSRARAAEAIPCAAATNRRRVGARARCNAECERRCAQRRFWSPKKSAPSARTPRPSC